jgi:hypothetical protein
MSATSSHNDSDVPETLASVNTGHTGKQINDQIACPLFRLPPELRNTTYTYVLNCKIAQCRCGHWHWDEEHNCPRVNLKHAKPRAPSNELLGSCRRVHNEGRGLFVKAQRAFWGNSTFFLELETSRLPFSFAYLDDLLDVHASHMTRVNIHTDFSQSQPFVVHLRSGHDVQSSVKAPVCTHRFYSPEPLSFID